MGRVLALRYALPDCLKDPVIFPYLSGWGVSEMRLLEWRDVDLTGNVVRLRAEKSKTKDGRVLPLHDELLDVIGRAQAKRTLECPFVFRLKGKPVGDFRKAWKNATKAAGLADVIVHNLRRTAIRKW
jgi:integrase